MRSVHDDRGGFSFGGSLGTMVRLLIAWNVIFFLVQELSKRLMPLLYLLIMDYLALAPADVWRGQIWQLATYMFLHGSWIHLGFNMLILWMFGTELEMMWGSRRFLTYYFFTGIGAGITNTIFDPAAGIPIVGASGAIYGLLLAFAIYFPNRKILLYFLFPIRARYFVLILGAIEFLASIAPGRSGIAHLAHLGGLLFGYLYLKEIPMRWLRRRRRPRRRPTGKIYDIRDYEETRDQDPRWR